MSPYDQDFPWVFMRDEIDLLEDEMEDLCETFHHKQVVGSFESMILREQMETEEQFDMELLARLGFDALECSTQSLLISGKQDDPADSLVAWQEELAHARSRPLYQKAKTWAAAAKPRARHGYELGGACAKEYFCIWANVNLVPLKIFAAMFHDCHEDDVGDEIAQEHYRLALIYLCRMLESMRILACTRDSLTWIHECRAEALELQEAIRLAISPPGLTPVL